MKSLPSTANRVGKLGTDWKDVSRRVKPTMDVMEPLHILLINTLTSHFVNKTIVKQVRFESITYSLASYSRK